MVTDVPWSKLGFIQYDSMIDMIDLLIIFSWGMVSNFINPFTSAWNA
jgi:hypothetical protein